MSRRIHIIAAAIVLSLASTSVFSIEPTSAEISSAQYTVDSYRELRKECVIARGELRKECFSALNLANTDYQEAKVLLARMENREDQENLHIVSNVY